MRFKGHTHWTELEPNGELKIPALYVPGWYLEAIEASTADLVYEGFQNFRNLDHLKVLIWVWIILSNNFVCFLVAGLVLLPAHG